MLAAIDKGIIFLLTLWNIWTFMIMGIDKYKAKTKCWRVSELHLMLMALFMGGCGMLFGMLIFRHKTKHLKFIIGVPLLLLANIIILVKGQQVLISLLH